MRPIHFIVVLWGERYRTYFTDWCLPSLLAPKNIPNLDKGEHKLVIVCPDEDWEQIHAHPTMQYASTMIEPLHLSFPRPKADLSPCLAMGPGHMLAANAAFEAKAYGVQLTPDCMLSDGLVDTIQREAQAGTQVLLILALRFSEESMLSAMAERNYYLKQQQLAIPARDMAAIGMASLHSETKTFEWGREKFAAFPSALWQPVEDGMVCMSLSWAPFLFDYGSLAALDLHTLAHWTMDGDYVYRNFSQSSAIKHITDTDRGVVVSWTPTKPTDDPMTVNGYGVTDIQRTMLRGAYHHGSFDPLKRKLFWEPVLYHPGPLTANYHEKAEALKDEIGKILWFDWRQMAYVNDTGKVLMPLHEHEQTSDYEKMRRR